VIDESSFNAVLIDESSPRPCRDEYVTETSLRKQLHELEARLAKRIDERLTQPAEHAGIEVSKKGFSGGSEEEVTTERLDEGSTWICNESMWDATICCGHESVGLAASIQVSVGCLLNFTLQTLFTLVVYGYMTKPMVDADFLNELLHFRAHTAHHIDHADPITQKSLAELVCDGTPKLHTAGTQSGLVVALNDYLEGGKPLMALAIILWMVTISKEINSTFNFCRALLSVKRGHRTKIVVAQSTGEDTSGDVMQKFICR
jgi:hypothetical protein